MRSMVNCIIVGVVLACGLGALGIIQGAVSEETWADSSIWAAIKSASNPASDADKASQDTQGRPGSLNRDDRGRLSCRLQGVWHGRGCGT